MAANCFGMICRSLSTSAIRPLLVKPPIQVFGTEGRYATALYSAASKNKALETVERDLKTVHDTLKKDVKFAEFMADPSVKKPVRAEAVAGVADKLKLNVLTKNMLTCMAENGRHNLLEEVFASFNTLMAAHRGEVLCEVVTAKPLDPAMTKEVEAAIASFLKKGEKSIVTYKVDPGIIGGMVVSVADKFIDMSMSSKITKYSQLIRTAA